MGMWSLLSAERVCPLAPGVSLCAFSARPGFLTPAQGPVQCCLPSAASAARRPFPLGPARSPAVSWFPASVSLVVGRVQSAVRPATLLSRVRPLPPAVWAGAT